MVYYKQNSQSLENLSTFGTPIKRSYKDIDIIPQGAWRSELSSASNYLVSMEVQPLELDGDKVESIKGIRVFKNNNGVRFLVTVKKHEYGKAGSSSDVNKGWGFEAAAVLTLLSQDTHTIYDGQGWSGGGSASWLIQVRGFINMGWESDDEEFAYEYKRSSYMEGIEHMMHLEPETIKYFTENFRPQISQQDTVNLTDLSDDEYEDVLQTIAVVTDNFDINQHAKAYKAGYERGKKERERR